MSQFHINAFSRDKLLIVLVAQSIHQLQKASYIQQKIDEEIALVFIRRNEDDELIQNIAPDSYILDDLDQLKENIHFFSKIIFFSLYASHKSAQLIEYIDELDRELFLIQETHSIPTHRGFHLGINFTPDFLFSASDEDKVGLLALNIAPKDSIASHGWMFQSNFFNWLGSNTKNSKIEFSDSSLMLLGAPSRIAANAHENLNIRFQLLNAIESIVPSANLVLKPHPMEDSTNLTKLIKFRKLNLKIWSKSSNINIFNAQKIITSAYSQVAIDFLCMQKDFIMYALAEDNFLTKAFSSKIIFDQHGIRLFEVNSSDITSKNIAGKYFKNEQIAIKLFKSKILEDKKIGNASIRQLEVMLAKYFFRKKVNLKSYLRVNFNNKKFKDLYKIIFEFNELVTLPRVETTYANRLYLYPIILKNLSSMYNPSDQLLHDFLNIYANERFFQIFLIETLILNNFLGHKKMLSALSDAQSNELNKTLNLISSKSIFIKPIFSLINKIYKTLPRSLTLPLFTIINTIIKLYGNYQWK